MVDWMKANKIYVAGAFLIVLAALTYFFLKPVENQQSVINQEQLFLEEENAHSEVFEEIEIIEEIIIVDVKGAVQKPGVYEAKANERVIDLINKAGGLNENADETKINFAIRVEDEMVIYVPIIGEETIELGDMVTIGATMSKEKNDGKVNLNTASEVELQALPGIGPAKAAAIIEFRNTNGPFKTIEDLKSISGIGEKTFEKLSNSIKVK